MMTPPPAGLRRLAAVLALSTLPMVALAEDAPPTALKTAGVHPWKLAYARRVADEKMESREAREEFARKSLLEWKRKHRAQGGGQHVRPATPDGSTPRAVEATPQPRVARRFESSDFTTPVNRIVNNRSGDSPTSGQSETSVAVFGDIVVAAWNDGQGFVSPTSDTQGWATSADGGITWTDRGTPPHPSGVPNFDWFSDPLVAVNEKTGAFYYSALCDVGSGTGVGVVKGRWNGSTIAWGNPVVAHQGPSSSDLSDKEWIVADSVSGRVYLTYSKFDSLGSHIMFQSADSNAVTWSAPQQLSLDTPEENGFVQGSRPIVDGDGRVYVVYELIGQGFADFYRVCHSDNHGASFGAPITAVSLYTNFGTGPPGFNRPLGIDFAGIAVDRSHGPYRGRVYLSWAESINWLDEVFTLGQAGDKSEVESNATPASATSATIGQTLRGSISFSDVDFYAVSLTQGQHIVVAADSAATSSSDAFSLRLFAGDGVTSLTFTTFDSAVNPGPGQPQGFPSGWLFTAPVSGTYYIRVAASTGQGAYRVRTGMVHRGAERGRDQRDIFVGYSDDGLSWSVPVRVNEDPPGFDQFTPEIAAAPDGGVYCTWYDYHDAPPATDGGEASVYLARSEDGGSTWTTLGPLTDVLSNWSAASTNIQPNQGDYMTMVTTDSYVWALWSDARNGDPDVFSARTPLIPNGGQVPGAFRLRMSPPRPNPIVGSTFVADFSLATDEPADVILYDVTGREVLRRRLALGKGPHTVSVPVPTDLSQGLYILTVRQSGNNASARALLIR